MAALTATLDEDDDRRLHLRGSASGRGLERVQAAVEARLGSAPSQLILDVDGVTGAGPAFAALLNELARIAALHGQSIVLEVPEDRAEWLAGASLDTALRVERTRRLAVSARPPVAAAVVGPTAEGVARREGRGFVTSYGHGRRCEAAGCRVLLSRYNSDALCWLHDPQIGARRG